jgi:hypothetical protein
MERHSEVSSSDLAVVPRRNGLAILLNLTCHSAYHMGQVRLAR